MSGYCEDCGNTLCICEHDTCVYCGEKGHLVCGTLGPSKLESIQKLEQRLKEAEAVIEFYADESHWDDRILLMLSDSTGTKHHAYCGGKRARDYINAKKQS